MNAKNDSLKRFPFDQHQASLAQLAEHALRKRMVMGSIPIGGFFLFFPNVHNVRANASLKITSQSSTTGLLA